MSGRSATMREPLTGPGEGEGKRHRPSSQMGHKRNLQTRRGSRPHRSGYPKAEGVKLDKMIALEANRSADELALIVPGAPSYDSILRVSAIEPR